MLLVQDSDWWCESSGGCILLLLCHSEAKWKKGIEDKDWHSHKTYSCVLSQHYVSYLKLLGSDNQEMSFNVPNNWEEMWHMLYVLKLFEDWVLSNSIL